MSEIIAEVFPSRMWEGNSIIKKVNKDTVTSYTHERNFLQDDLSVLGVEHMEWREGESVIFPSSDTTSIVKLR
ncbi:hypothetical protein [Lysinibacillus fusiformis]|uniref:hypothetical protein n=1 Tax=Lysinibacillus fusiformis TaxID=28031 RepID=UPI003D02B3A5